MREPGRRERLLAAGMEIFQTKSVDDVSVDEIADRAGVAHGLLFHYFGSKGSFYVAVVAEMLDQLGTAFDANQATDPAEWLAVEVDTFLDVVVDQPGLVPAAEGAAPTGFAREELVEVTEAFRQRTIDRLLHAIDVAEPSPLLRLAVRGWIGTALEVRKAWRRGPTVDREAVHQLLVDAFVDVLRSVERAEPDVPLDAERFA